MRACEEMLLVMEKVQAWSITFRIGSVDPSRQTRVSQLYNDVEGGGNSFSRSRDDSRRGQTFVRDSAKTTNQPSKALSVESAP